MELTQKKAIELNELVRYIESIEEPFPILQFFDAVRIEKTKFNHSYYDHLLSLANELMKKYEQKWFKVNGAVVMKTYNTKPFLDEGGFLTIYKKEKQEQAIKDLTEQQLNKSVFQLRYWWVILLINAIISFIIAWFTKD